MSGESEREEKKDDEREESKYETLILWTKKWFPSFFAFPIIVMALSQPWGLKSTAFVSTIICIVAFYLTAYIVSEVVTKNRSTKIQHELSCLVPKIRSLNLQDSKETARLQRRLLRYCLAKQRIGETLSDEEISELKKLEYAKVEEKLDDKESPAVIAGMGGLYAIINGLGISEALTGYGKSLVSKQFWIFLAPMTYIVFDSSHTLRLIAFLATMVPFIHGFILTFSNRWYYDIEYNTTHYEWAFLFFLVVFVQSVLLFFAALNLQKFEVFIIMIWSLMVFNTPWLWVQIRGIMKRKINVVYVFPKQWIILNLNTAAFLSIFIFAPQQTMVGAQDDVFLNGLIFSVLLSRSIFDYKIAWIDLYNRKPDMELYNSILENKKGDDAEK